MDFYEVLDQIIDLLRRRGRVTYRALKRQFRLEDDFLEDVKDEIIKAQQLAVDENSEVLVWTGSSGVTPPTPIPSTPVAASLPSSDQEQEPLSYTPQHLADKVLTSRSALQGERKQVTVMFADIKDSTELIRDLDPEAAQQLLDPAIHIMMNAVHRVEGTVNQVLGDGIMSIFGAPIAHEDSCGTCLLCSSGHARLYRRDTTESGPNIRSVHMSIETATAFRDKVTANPAMREQIKRSTDHNPADIIRLGAEYGFEFTEAEWYQASYPNDKDVLGSFDLDQRSGKQE
jgi:predicted ribosomally synthesized peptide with nif11-like leader